VFRLEKCKHSTCLLYLFHHYINVQFQEKNDNEKNPIIYITDTDDYARVALPSGQDDAEHPDSSDVESVVEDEDHQGFAF